MLVAAGVATYLVWPSSSGAPAGKVSVTELPVCKPPVVHAATTEDQMLAGKAYCENWFWNHTRHQTANHH